MFKIGYFARISGVALARLRYYDRVLQSQNLPSP